MPQQYIWQDAYQRAVLEKDNLKLQVLLWEARIDLQKRLNSGPEMLKEEATAIHETIKGLAALAQERLRTNILCMRLNEN